MVAGRVYNSEQMPPYTLHACAHMMGFRSNSTKGGGCNEIVIHAQKDMATTVEHDQTNMVVTGNQINTVSTGWQHDTTKGELLIKSTDDQIYIEA